MLLLPSFPRAEFSFPAPHGKRRPREAVVIVTTSASPLLGPGRMMNIYRCTVGFREVRGWVGGGGCRCGGGEHVALGFRGGRRVSGPAGAVASPRSPPTPRGSRQIDRSDGLQLYGHSRSAGTEQSLHYASQEDLQFYFLFFPILWKGRVEGSIPSVVPVNSNHIKLSCRIGNTQPSYITLAFAIDPEIEWA